MSEATTRCVGYRFRAYPDEGQRERLEHWQSAQRALWNAGHAQRLERLSRPGWDIKRKKRYLSAYDQHAELTECRREYEWLRAVPQMFQQDLLTQLSIAWQRFFTRISGKPQFKRRSTGDDAPLGVAAKDCRIVNRNCICLPKLGELVMRGHRRLRGKPVRVSLTREVDQWFVSITCEVQHESSVEPPGLPVGLDLGVANIVADSLGRLVVNPRELDRQRRRIARAQRVVARRKRGRGQRPSKNYAKAQKRVAKLHRTIRRRRMDLLHKLTHHYAKSHGVVVIEDLKVSAMSSSAHGTRESPGRRVRAKSGLNRSILGVGWYELRRQLTYKCAWYGSQLVVVDPKFTSQQCPRCHRICANNRLSQAQFLCVNCGYARHADVAGAMNILARGLGLTGASPETACGGLADVGRPLRQEETRVSALESSPVL